MPIYEYYCPEHGKFEALRAMEERHNAPCPRCLTKSKLVVSKFHWKWFNPFTQDGEGYTERFVPEGELRENIQETRGR
jgi:putative FmdB family regulatory protein